jgi:hypothetical protein
MCECQTMRTEAWCCQEHGAQVPIPHVMAFDVCVRCGRTGLEIVAGWTPDICMFETRANDERAMKVPGVVPVQEAKEMPGIADHVDPGVYVEIVGLAPPVETAMIYCQLAWCAREHPCRVVEKRGIATIYEEADLYCSPRCREYDERKNVVEQRYTDFMKRTKMVSEWLWASAKHAEELAPLERQFRSLRVE